MEINSSLFFHIECCVVGTPLGVAAMLNMMSIEGCYTDASPLILPQPHKGVANYYTHHVARLRGESLHSLSLICSSPRYVAGTPKGVLLHHSWTLPLLLNIELSTTQQFFFSEKQMRFFML